MKFFLVFLLQFLVFFPLCSQAAPAAKGRPAAALKGGALGEAGKRAVIESFGRLPMYFIENRGQVSGALKFYERGPGHATFFTGAGVVVALSKDGAKAAGQALHKDTGERLEKETKTETLRLAFIGAEKDARIIPGGMQSGRVNYFIGSDPSRWRSGVPTYGSLTYRDLYRNIDVKFYGNNRRLEHDIIVHPGGDVSSLRFAYEGAGGLRITESGDLEVRLSQGSIIETRPVVYQVVGGKRVAVKGGYRLIRDREGAFSYGFAVASYDRTRDLVIDPVIVYSTYLGGTDVDYGYGIAVDPTGAVYIAGQTWSADFPTAAPLQAVIGGTRDAFVTKINPAGSAIVYSTYLGGSGFEQANAIAVDRGGAAYITGWTGSTDFPLVGAIQGTYGGGTDDVFITKLNPTGSAIVYSTYLGGSRNRDEGFDIAVDPQGLAYVTGITQSFDFPLVGAMQGTTSGESAFIAKVNASGSAFVYSTYLGGSSSNQGNAIAVDNTGNAIVVGITRSADFPTTLNAFQTSMGINGTLSGDGFVSKIDTVGSSLLYSSFLGGDNSDKPNAVALDSTGAAYITGETSSNDFPTVNPIQPTRGGFISNVFVTKVNPAGSALVYSTYLGGGANMSVGNAIAVNSAGEAYVYGTNLASDFPVVNPIPGMAFHNSGAPFLTKVDAGGTQWLFSTPIGNDSFAGPGNGWDMAMDSKGTVYITGQTQIMGFPTVNPIQPALGGAWDAFVTRISDAVLPVVTLMASPDFTSLLQGETLTYRVTATNTTTTNQCFDYWEDVLLPNSTLYPPGGTLFGPHNTCLAPGASQTVGLAHQVPIGAPAGAYVFNSYIGAYLAPTFKIVVDEYHFDLNISAVAAPLESAGRGLKWPLVKNGFAR